MSDSECDLLQNNFYTFQHESSTISAKGPNVNKTLTNLNFGRNNMLTSTLLVPKNFERSGLGEHSYYNNSVYNRRDRDTSPTSMRSIPTMSKHKFHDVYHGMNHYSQRSMMNAREGSPMSIRTIDSTTSMRAVDIAMALKEGQFNKYDLRIIKEAYHNLVKSRMRRKIEKKRKKRFRSNRRNSYDSGEQGSDSSVSSIDCKSMKTASFKDNMSSCRSTRTDLCYLKHAIKESNIYKDCTDTIRQNTFRNMATSSRSVHGDYRAAKDSYGRLNTFSTGTKSVNGDFSTIENARQSTFRNTFTTGTQSVNGDYRASNSVYRNSQFKAPRSVCSDTIRNKSSLPVIRDRFKHHFLLPSQRFNKSVASLTIPENTSKELCNKPAYQGISSIQQNTAKVNSSLQIKHVTNYPSDSDDDDDIFPQTAHNEKKQTVNRKRSLDNDESNKTPNKKKKKSQQNMSPENNIQANDANERNSTNQDFNFLKPTLPAKKSLNGKINEVIVARSAPPISVVTPPAKSDRQEDPCNTIHSESLNDKQTEISQNSSADVSSRPSFIKRKLFSQKLDVTEAKDKTDSSSESPQVDSYKSLIREKNKARKLVINNSCLNRDISGVNNNLLDLIHKIVPAEQMNMTNVANQTNKSEAKNTTDPNEKWDVTSVISTCNNKDNVSDTFTDDELFCFTIRTDKKDVKTKAKDVNPVSQPKKDTSKNIPVIPCKVVVEAMNKNIVKKVQEEKKISFSCVDNFFDTDYETDSESKKIDKQITSKTMSSTPAQSNEILEKAKELVKNHNNPTKNPNQKTIEADNSLVKLTGKKAAVNENPKSKDKPSTTKVNNTKQKPECNKITKNIKSKQQTDANDSKTSSRQPPDQNKVVSREKINKNSKTQSNAKSKGKKKELDESNDAAQKVSRSIEERNNNAKKNDRHTEIHKNEQKADCPLSKEKISKTKPKSTNAKLQDSNVKESDKNNASLLNNTRSRRIRTPRPQKENIPVNNIKTRSGNKSNKKVASTKNSTTKKIMQDSFTLLENNNTKHIERKTNKPKVDLSLSTSMTLRSQSLQEIDEIPKNKKNEKRNGKMCERKREKDNKVKNPITKTGAKIQTLCNSSMSLRVRSNPRKDVSYVY